MYNILIICFVFFSASKPAENKIEKKIDNG